jgi:hypothetical protein
MKTLIPALAAALTISGALAATPALADSRVVVHYGDGYGHSRDWRDAPRTRDRDRDGIPNRYDRYDNRRGYSHYEKPHYAYRAAPRCWSEWRYDRWQDRRVKVRVCR